jgi:hypothetical protein
MQKVEPIAIAGGIEVHYSFDELVDMEKLVPNPKKRTPTSSASWSC